MTSRLKIIAVLFFSFWTSGLFGSPQMPDYIICLWSVLSPITLFLTKPTLSYLQKQAACIIFINAPKENISNELPILPVVGVVTDHSLSHQANPQLLAKKKSAYYIYKGLQ
jgi:hypothetical protein